MTLRSLALLATISISAISAQAGTIIFHTGDALHPPVGVDFWSVSTSGSVLTGCHTHTDDFPVAGSVYVEDFRGDFHHTHWGAVPGSPPVPENGTTGAQATTNGDVYWWFEYVPDNPLDVPDPAHSYYADIQVRGKAEVHMTARSERGAGGVAVSGGVNGLLTSVLCMASVSGGPARDDESNYTTGYPAWQFQEDPSGFNFVWDAASGKWLGKASWLGAGVTQINSVIPVSDETVGFQDNCYRRQLQVLRVRTPSGGTFTFNTAWS